MSNPFDNKIKESLENFEMPYDTGAWAELAKQLPPEGAVVGASGSQFSWKAAAIIGVLAASMATIWYLNSDSERTTEESVVLEQTPATEKESIKAVDVAEVETAPREELSVVESTDVKENNARSVESNKEEKESVISYTEQQFPFNENAKSTIAEIDRTVSETVEPANAESGTTDEAKPLDAKFIASNLNVCVGEEVNFINESSDKSAQMMWSFGDGSTSTEINPEHVFVIPGNYTVTLNCSADAKMAEKSVQINVNPSPSVVLSPSRKIEGYEAIPYFRFSTALQPSETAVWKFSDGLISNGASAEHLFRNAGKSSVELTITNSFGCSTSLDWETDIQKFNLLSYTGFSPDGNGTNETFMPKALPLMGLEFEMVIRNQTGQTVYETSNANEPWNGRLNNNGPLLEQGIYVWIVVIKENIIDKKDFNGTITLKR